MEQQVYILKWTTYKIQFKMEKVNMKLINLDENEFSIVKEFFKKVLKEEVEKLQNIDNFVVLLEKMDEIRNSILLLDVLEEYNKITKEEMLENIKRDKNS